MIVKTEEDRAKVRKSGAILAGVLDRLCEAAKPGVSSMDLDSLARNLIEEAGAEPVFLNYRPEGEPRPYPAAICLSVNEMVVHGIPNEIPFTIHDGDVVSIDCGVRFEGVITDATRTVIAGKAKKEDEDLLAAAEEALEAAVKAAKSGARVGDISSSIEEVANKYGFGVPRELGGHGLGNKLHEDPFVANWGTAGTGPVLSDGEMLAIEPIFTAGKPHLDWDDEHGYECRTRDGSNAVQVEHTIIVGENGGEIVTS